MMAVESNCEGQVYIYICIYIYKVKSLYRYKLVSKKGN